MFDLAEVYTRCPSWCIHKGDVCLLLHHWGLDSFCIEGLNLKKMYIPKSLTLMHFPLHASYLSNVHFCLKQAFQVIQVDLMIPRPCLSHWNISIYKAQNEKSKICAVTLHFLIPFALAGSEMSHSFMCCFKVSFLLQWGSVFIHNLF